MKEIYEAEIARVTAALQGRGVRFAVVADSHLDDNLADTFANIAAVDKNASFAFLLHLGDFLNGNLPRRVTARLLSEQMGLFRDSTAGGVLYPVQGNHDGFITDRALDEDWFAATSFVGEYPNVCRPQGKPYFYVDMPAQKLRIVLISSFHYEIKDGKFRKRYGVDEAQVSFLREQAFVIPADYTVIVASHDHPIAKLNDESFVAENTRINGKETLGALLDAREKYGFTVAAWFIGHEHGDALCYFRHIPFVYVGSATAYVPQLWDMVGGGSYAPRKKGTVSEDLWDAVLLDQENRVLRLVRFGAGEDRTVAYGENGCEGGEA